MNFLRGAAVLASIVILMPALFPAGGGLSVSIAHPVNGSVLHSRTVTICGTAERSTGRWYQAEAADFQGGVPDNVTIGSNDLTLGDPNEILLDDFNEFPLDTSKWTLVTQHGMSCSLADGVVMFHGTSDTQAGYWISTAYLKSKSDFYTAFADTKFVGGSGLFSAFLRLYQDDANWVGISVKVDNDLPLGKSIVTEMMKGGALTTDYQGGAGNGVHAFGVSYSGGQARLFMDLAQVEAYNLDLSSPKLVIGGSLCYFGHSMQVQWDDARGNTSMNYCYGGIYLSSLHDTGSKGPVLERASWNASLPARTYLAVQVRSLDSPSDATPSQWCPISNGQTSGFPPVERYLQYWLRLTSLDGFDTPVFREILFVYGVPLERVEVSVDDQATWKLAQGTASWSASVTLPEAVTKVWVRVTDSAGMSALSSIMMTVDITRPSGTVLINGGAECSDSSDVVLAFKAVDNFKVESVKFSEDPRLADAQWLGFAPEFPMTLSGGDGKKTVHALFRDSNGLVSEQVSDDIVLDTSVPSGSFRINGGAEFTRDANVTLELNATDSVGVTGVMASNDAGFSGGQWSAFASSIPWSLAPGDGVKVVHLKFRDGCGHVSRPCSASMTLDTLPPRVAVAINSGAMFTNSSNVTLSLAFVENFRVDRLEVSEDPLLRDPLRVPAAETVDIVLSPGDGMKRVFTRATDAAGNVGPANVSSMVLDRVAPTSSMDALPTQTGNASFLVSWKGEDAASGIRWFDVQVREGTGPWTDWQQGTPNTKAAYAGRPGTSYSFRVRAMDNAGNLQAFQARPGATVTVRAVYLPVTLITFPAEGAHVKGGITITGKAFHPDDWKGIELVQVRIDGGDWRDANGTLDWQFPLDTRALADGVHHLEARAFDGERHSLAAGLNFTVVNAERERGTPWSAVIMTVILAFGLAAGMGLARMLRLKKGAPPSGGAD